MSTIAQTTSDLSSKEKGRFKNALVKHWRNLVFLVVVFCLLAWSTGRWPHESLVGCAFLGFVSASVCFRLLLSASQKLLSGQSLSIWGQCAGVAKALLLEADRKRGIGAGAQLAFLLMVLLPLVLSQDGAVGSYEKNILAFGLNALTLLLTVMSIFLSCETLAGEILSKEAHVTLVKPVRRSVYLFGKWFGIIILNSIILGLSGLLLFLFVCLPSQLEGDAKQVEQVQLQLQPYLEIPPDLPADFQERLDQAVQAKIANERVIAQGAGPQAYADIEEKFRQKLYQRFRHLKVGKGKEYIFTDIHPTEEHVQLRMQISSSPPQTSSTFQIRVEAFKGDELVYNKMKHFLVSELFHINLNSSFIQDGKLRLRIHNPVIPNEEEQASLIFTNRHGLKLAYSQGSFAENLLRSILIIGVQISFLALAGLCASTFLGFAVASLSVLILAFCASMSSFLKNQISGPVVNPNDSSWVSSLIVMFQKIGYQVVEFLLSFGKFSPQDSLVNGKIVPWSSVGSAFLLIICVWGVFLLLPTLFIFKKREIARVQV